MKSAYPAGRGQGPWDEERRADAAFEEMWSEVPRRACASSPRGGGGAVALSTENWNGTSVDAGAAETVDSGDFTELWK